MRGWGQEKFFWHYFIFLSLRIFKHFSHLRQLTNFLHRMSSASFLPLSPRWLASFATVLSCLRAHISAGACFLDALIHILPACLVLWGLQSHGIFESFPWESLDSQMKSPPHLLSLSLGLCVSTSFWEVNKDREHKSGKKNLRCDVQKFGISALGMSPTSNSLFYGDKLLKDVRERDLLWVDRNYWLLF